VTVTQKPLSRYRLTHNTESGHLAVFSATGSGAQPSHSCAGPIQAYLRSLAVVLQRSFEVAA
jgi:hypothetical protein